MGFLDDPVFLGGIFAFLDSEVFKCPHCGAVIDKSDAEANAIDENTIKCSHCDEPITTDDLKSILDPYRGL